MAYTRSPWRLSASAVCNPMPVLVPVITTTATSDSSTGPEGLMVSGSLASAEAARGAFEEAGTAHPLT